MSATRIEVTTATLLTISTGRFLTESFSDFHAAADVVMAQPLMTHQFASEAVASQMEREVKRQHPWLDDSTLLDDFPSLDGLPRDAVERACREWVGRLSEIHGETHTLVSPPETRHVSLLEGLPAKFGGAA